MVIVMQLFAANQDAPGRNIGGSVTAFEIAVADSVAKAIDHARSKHGDPHHLYGPHGDAQRAEQGEVYQCHKGYATDLEAAVDIALDPVIRAVLAVDAQGVFVFGLFHIKLCALAQYGRQSFVNGAVGIFWRLAFGMVFTVNSGPFTGVHAGGEP